MMGSSNPLGIHGPSPLKMAVFGYLGTLRGGRNATHRSPLGHKRAKTSLDSSTPLLGPWLLPTIKKHHGTVESMKDPWPSTSQNGGIWVSCDPPGGGRNAAKVTNGSQMGQTISFHPPRPFLGHSATSTTEKQNESQKSTRDSWFLASQGS